MPDFFIIGAPKCGTSALFEYLAAHPAIFAPSDKEPHHYSDDMYTRDTGLVRRVADKSAYDALFAAAGPDQMTGEGSTWYLFSERAVPNILRDTPDARFIVMLRQPAVMVQSLHAHHLRKLYDDVEDLEAAWALNDVRARGQRLPRHCPDPKMLDYGAACSFAPMLERLFALVPRDRVCVHVFEEFFADPAAGYRETLAFLGLADDGRDSFEKVNPNRTLRSKRAYALAVYKPFPINYLYPVAKRLFNAVGLRPGRMLFERNVTVQARAPVTPGIRKTLESFFAADIARTEALLGRRIEAWHP